MIGIGRLLLAGLLLVSPMAAWATQKPAKIAITPTAKKAVVILRAPFLPTPYRLGISRYDAAGRKLQSGIGGGWADINIERSGDADFIVRDIEPGTYVIRDVAQQGIWAACFHRESLQFTITAGQALFLGDWNPIPSLGELQRAVMLSGKISMPSNEVAHYFDNISAPLITAPTAEGVADAARFLAAASPKTTVAPTAVNYAPATFGTGTSLFGQKLCGGYNKKAGAEPAPKPAS